MKFITAFIAILITARLDNPIQQTIFAYFDAVRGVASAIFISAGADRLSDCMEDGDDIESTITKIEYLIAHFDAKTMFQDMAVIFADILSIYDDCKAFWESDELSVVGKAFKKMADTFSNNMGTFITKEVVAILAEGTNLMNEINDIVADFNNKKYFEAGFEIGDIIADFTVKLF
jgi:hypothetical protein